MSKGPIVVAGTGAAITAGLVALWAYDMFCLVFYKGQYKHKRPA